MSAAVWSRRPLLKDLFLLLTKAGLLLCNVVTSYKALKKGQGRTIIPTHRRYIQFINWFVSKHDHMCSFSLYTVAVIVDVSNIWHRTKIEEEVLKALHLHRAKPAILVLNKVETDQCLFQRSGHMHYASSASNFEVVPRKL